MPTPTPTQFTRSPAPVLRIVHKRGAAVGSTPAPAALRTPIAGSAKVANAPKTNPNAKLVGKQEFQESFSLVELSQEFHLKA